MPILKRHGAVVLLALLVAFVTIGPEIYFAQTHGYAGIPMFGTDAETHYAARVAEAMQAAPQFGNPFFVGGDAPAFIPSLGERITAMLGWLTGQRASVAVILAKFVFPFIVTLLFYALALALFDSRRIALVGSAAAMLGDNLMSSPGAWTDLFHGVSHASEFITYARPVNPEVSELFLLGVSLIFFIAFIKRRSPRIAESIAIGVLSAASLYVSPYVATFLAAFLLAAALFELYKRAWNTVAHLVLAGATALICLIPFALNYRALIASPLYAESSLRFGLIATHAPMIGIWLAVLIAAVFFPWKHFEKAHAFFVIAAIALVLVLNEQVLTGHALSPSHYHWYIEKPIILLLASAFGVLLLERFVASRAIQRLCIALALLVLLYNSVLVQIASYRAQVHHAAQTQIYAPAFAYLSAVQDRPGVWADRNVADLLPIFAPVASVNDSYADYYIASTGALRMRLFLEYRLHGVSAAGVLATMRAERADISNRIFGIYYRDQFGDYAAIPDTLLTQFAAKYATYLKEPLEQSFAELGITYILWNRNLEPEWGIDTLPFVTEVFRSGPEEIYRLRTTQ